MPSLQKQPFHRHRLLLVLLTILICGVMYFPHATQATTSLEFLPEIPLPGLFENKVNVDSSLMAQYIRAVFIYFIWIVGTVATFMIIYGGIRWVAAAGNAGRIKDARDIIDNAVIGVIIALTSIVLLNIINPKLTQLSIPNVSTIIKKYAPDLRTVAVCPTSLKTDCGQARQTGLIVIDGKQTPEYCLGAACTSNVGACPMSTFSAPTTSSDPNTLRYAAVGDCTAAITIPKVVLPNLGTTFDANGRASTTDLTLETLRIVSLLQPHSGGTHIPLSCGVVALNNEGGADVGNRCADGSSCVMLNASFAFVQSTIPPSYGNDTIGTITNMKCLPTS